MKKMTMWRIVACATLVIGASACGGEAEPDQNNAMVEPTNNSTPGNSTTPANNTANHTSPTNNTSPANHTTPANNTSPANHTTPANNTTPSDEVTYHADVKPLLSQYCTRCHFDGGQGPLDFTNGEDVAALSEVILDAIDSGRMPPAVADPSCEDYHGSERMVLSPEARTTLQDWVDGGKIIGEDDGISPLAPEYATLQEPDLELRISERYTPTYSSMRDTNNEYRCFVLEHNQEGGFYITSMHPIVDTPEIVHHVVLAKSPRDKVPPGVAQAGGQDCIDDMSALGDFGDGGGIISAWAPGMEPVVFDKAGIEVKKNDVFILQMHYYSGGGDTDGLSDQSGYAMKIASSVRNRILMAPLGKFDFQIPPNEEAHTETQELDLPVGVTLWGAFPHMHVLGKSYSLTFEDEGEERCLLEGERYDFDNQLTYMYKEPVFIPGGSPITLSCTWNNSLSNPDLLHMPPRPVGYGERTDEEMCYAFSYISIGKAR